MEVAGEKEGTPGGDPQRVAAGARPRPAAAGGDGAGDLAGSPEAGDGQERNGRTGIKTTEEAGALTMDLVVVKQEVVDWSDLDGAASDSHWVKQEAEGGPEVKDEKGALEVKQEVVKEEEMEEPEVKEEKNVKEEQGMDGVPVKEEDCLKREATEDSEVKEEPQMNPRVGCKRKLAMSRCETCGTEEAKYRCPRCMRYSCSLPCVKKHKAELTCNGVRDKTAYVSLQQFTEMNLLSDYRFLEDVARTADQVSRDTFLKRPKRKKYLLFMKNRARKQGIYLRLLPNGFSKRKENSTMFDHRKQQFCWHVQLQFPQSQAEYTERRVPDDKTINEILKPYIDPEKSDPVIRQRLKAYTQSQTGVQILMRVENMQQNMIRYYELDPYKSLLDNLRNKVIIEYPTLHVVLRGSGDGMQLLHQVKSESAQKLGSGN
ncbi:box C/D snoRNA protein 1 isoform X2 [Apodemus sylvaticus]|uniref:box C/D snoRNA protein 1 isoform X2 n=1 Tax=Apodemus sylvaticus TaxID=10129 RepID=UPI002244A928|nr:box C/D snoRNA protein 1 isoform X2 [Apodemus sylvaticus]